MVHVVFDMHAAHSIRQALDRLGRQGRVLAFPDNTLLPETCKYAVIYLLLTINRGMYYRP